MDRMLVVVPMGPNDRRARTATIQGILALEWEGVLDIIWMYNSSPESHFEDLARKFNEAADLCVFRDYDAMCIIEYDMIVPEDALLKLAAVDADIVYGLYCSRSSSNHLWLLAKRIDEHDVEWPKRTELTECWGNVVATVGVGTGCTLIKAEALKKLAFRCGKASPDWYMAVDAQQLGLSQAHHCGVVCGHIVDDTQVVWPDATRDSLYRVERLGRALELSSRNMYRVLPGQQIAIDEKKQVVRTGELVGLGSEQAAIMLRKGVVECA